MAIEQTFCLNTLPALIRKYSGHVPRYTSYPTAVEFDASVDSEHWRRALQEELVQEHESNKSASLYVHIPFCRTLCYFCACNKKITLDDSPVAPYLAAVSQELKKISELTSPDLKLEQIHWGGGTPNFLSPEMSEQLFANCRESFSLAPDAEVSIELDPRTSSARKMTTYRRLGFNRVSLGVQDFDPRVQRAVNRVQSFEQTRDTCLSARELGFSSINIDLIYGLPNQNETSFARTIEQVLEIRPERIALYGYAHVTWKKKVQKALERHVLPLPEQRLALFLLALRMLSSAGYRYIGLDHFALPDDELAHALDSGMLNRNFMGYSTIRGAAVVGVGVSAVSSLPSILVQNSSDLESYQSRALTGGLATARGKLRSTEDRLRGELIEEILCCGRIDFAKFEHRWEICLREAMPEVFTAMSSLEADGLVCLTDDSLSVTATGRLFLRSIASLFDAYMLKHSSQQNRVFSQSV